MKDLIDAELSYNSMKLRQFGGDVTVINSKMCYVKFNIEGLKVSYVYNINKDGKYFLERMLPYPIPIKEFDYEDDIADLIAIDLEQFQNASRSSHIEQFIEINKKLHHTIQKFEDLFLYYNVPEENTEKIAEKLLEIDAEIARTKATAKRVYHKKDPDSL